MANTMKPAKNIAVDIAELDIYMMITERNYVTEVIEGKLVDFEEEEEGIPEEILYEIKEILCNPDE